MHFWFFYSFLINIIESHYSIYIYIYIYIYNPNEVYCISLSANTLSKYMNLTILISAVVKIGGRLGTFVLLCQPVLENENSEFKPVKLRQKMTL